ncbi:MAG: hypothetical protein LBG96_06125 [Tannerella sp.]|jgi:hypothetical protein|nr:hypothetical protein [Tannerella sp.]
MEALCDMIDRTPEELIEQLMENHEFAAKMECLLAAMEHYYQRHTQTA